MPDDLREKVVEEEVEEDEATTVMGHRHLKSCVLHMAAVTATCLF
jgi:hypothetical protein